jgi:HD-like signal output (HDOD) protein
MADPQVAGRHADIEGRCRSNMRAAACSMTPQTFAATIPRSSPETLSAWVARFRAAEIPVLAETAALLEELRGNEDECDANGLGELFSADPLMTLKLLAHAATHRSSRVVTDVETVIAALVMMGISPFFRVFGPQPTVEQWLHERPQALDGLREVLRRAHRAAHFALGLAIHRTDHDAAVIHQAALLNDFAEMLLWCHAPALALEIRDLQRADPTLRSSAAQQTVLGFELAELKRALMQAWRLPELLINITDHVHVEHPSVRNVMLAIRLARHTAQGWDNPALPDDVRDIGALLNLSTDATLTLLQELDR